MITGEVVLQLESEYDRTSGFLGQLRSGHYDPLAFERLLAILRSVDIADAPAIDRRLVSLLWLMPSFIRWQEERVLEEGTEVGVIRSAADKVEAILIDQLGAP